MRADFAELMYADEAAKNGMIANFDVPGQGGVVGKDHAVTDPAIVGDMHIGHEQAVTADLGDPPAADRAAAEGATLADDIAITDLKARGLPSVFKVLRRFADGTELKYFVFNTDSCRPVDNNVRTDPGAVADFNIRPDDGKRPDLYTLPEPRTRVDDGLWMNHLFKFPIGAHQFGRTTQLVSHIGIALIH